MTGFGRNAFLGLALLVAGGAHAATCDDPDIAKALTCLDGVTSREVPLSEDPKIPTGYRRFEITIEQPDDQYHPEKSGRFKQRLVLLHKSTSEPMVLQTSGYKIFAVALSDLAKNFGANQIQVEHRFFDQSVPSAMDWRLLNLSQSAIDFHRIVEAFRRVYPKRWVNTGGSKGGMTSIFHRRFFPRDLDGTVADVAPLSFSNDDARYIGFVEEAGGAKYRDCREKLSKLQVAMLRRRNELMDLITGSFVYLGGKSVAYEHAVIELSFAYWQYQDPEHKEFGCDKIPASDAPAKDIVKFLKVANGMDSYSDGQLFTFMPYYFQAATQLGSPAAGVQHLNGYRLHPYNVDQYTPHLAKYQYTNAAMREMETWTVSAEADRMMFVYGEFDPWTAGAYPRVSKAKDFHWFQVPSGNHGSKLFKLPPVEKEKALAAVSRWMGKLPVRTSLTSEEPSLDDLELEMRRAARLP